MVPLLKKLVEINSCSRNPEGLTKCCNILETVCKTLEGTLTRHKLHDGKTLSAAGVEEKLIGGDILHLRRDKPGKKKVLFAGHYDTVHPKASRFQKFFLDEEDGCAKGPGALDMKGGLVILLTALAEFEKLPEAQNLSWEVCLVPDEELGSPLSTPFLKERAKEADYGLIFEPALEDGDLASERKGSANLSFLVKGKPAHAGRNPEEGKSAIFAAAELCSYLEQLKSDTILVNVGTIFGGGKLNVVPHLATVTLNVRFSTIEEFRQVESFINFKSIYLKKKRGVEIESKTHTIRPPKQFTAETRKLFARLKTAAEKCKIPLSWRPVGGVCDGNTLASCGVPTIDTLGPVGTGIHTEEEMLFLESLEERKNLTVELLKILGKKSPL